MGGAGNGKKKQLSSSKREHRSKNNEDAIAAARRRAAWQWLRSDQVNVRARSTDISVKKAPRISDIVWGNLTVSPWKKLGGSCCSAVLISLAIFVALGIQGKLKECVASMDWFYYYFLLLLLLLIFLI